MNMCKMSHLSQKRKTVNKKLKPDQQNQTGDKQGFVNRDVFTVEYLPVAQGIIVALKVTTGSWCKQCTMECMLAKCIP